jgi:Tol biopolymer transport system component
VAWSNDGKRIAYSYGRYAAPLGTLHEFDLRAGRQNVLATVPNGIVSDVVWVAGNRLLILYSEKGPSFLRSQIGILPAGAGELRPITRDTASYSTLTVSADKRVAATVQRKTTRTLDFISVSSQTVDSGSPRAPVERVGAFDWTVDGHLIVSDGSRLVRLASDATQTTLINDVGAATLSVASCKNGYVLINWAFRAGTDGSAIWRVDRDGANPKRLSPGPNDTSPVCTPDGQWAYYLDGLLTVMRVPVEGGHTEAVPIRNVPNTYEHLGGLALSDDGRQLMLIANTTDLSSSHEHDTIEVFDLHRDSALVPQVIEPVRSIIAYLYGGGPRFSPDRKSIVYATTEKDVWNLWMQPLDGSPGRRITNFPSGRITEFRWSPDGKTLAVQRESDSSDVVLLRQRSH